MDAHTREPERDKNAAMLLALMWFYAGDGQGKKDMVILPYKDRLALFSKYLQQLVMESLGKEKDLDGKVVHQGIAVYGNKGSTDQHAYVQQLRDGVPNFFVTFIEVRKDRATERFEVDDWRDERRLFAGISPRHARRALRRRARFDHAQHSRGRRISRRRTDRTLRTRGRVLRLARERERLPSTWGRSRERKRRREFCSCSPGCWLNFQPPARPPKRLRTRSTPIRKRSTTCCDTSRPTTRRLKPAVTSLGPKNFRGSSSAPSSHRLDSLRRRHGDARGSPNVQAEPNILWTELTKFVGQLNHDLRNHLNAIELQVACLSEIVREAEASSEIRRLREMTGDLCAHLQRLSASLAEIQPSPMRLSRHGICRGSAGQAGARTAGAGRRGGVEEFVRRGSS